MVFMKSFCSLVPSMNLLRVGSLYAADSVRRLPHCLVKSNVNNLRPLELTP